MKANTGNYKFASPLHICNTKMSAAKSFIQYILFPTIIARYKCASSMCVRVCVRVCVQMCVCVCVLEHTQLL